MSGKTIYINANLVINKPQYSAYQYKAIFKGELLKGGFDAVVLDKDGGLAGDRSKARYLHDDRAVYFYIQKELNDTTEYKIDTKTEERKVRTINIKSLAASTSHTSVDSSASSEYAPLKYSSFRMERLNQGDFFPAGNDVVVEFKKKVKGDEDEEISKKTIHVYDRYRFAINTGFVYMNETRIEFVKGKDGKIIEEKRDEVLPILTLTIFWEERSYADNKVFEWKYLLVPNLMLGFRLDEPGRDIFIGGAFEPYRGIHFVIGKNYGRRTQLSGNQSVNDILEGEQQPITTEKYIEHTFIGVTFDMNLFGKKTLELAGF